MKRLKIVLYIDVDDKDPQGKEMIDEIKETVESGEYVSEFDEPFVRNPLVTLEITDIE